MNERNASREGEELRCYTRSVTPRDPAVARFIARHSKPPREAVDEDAAPWRGVSPEEKLRATLELCAQAALFLEMNPNREWVLAEKAPPHPSFSGIMKRLRERQRVR